MSAAGCLDHLKPHPDMESSEARQAQSNREDAQRVRREGLLNKKLCVRKLGAERNQQRAEVWERTILHQLFSDC